MKFIDLFAGIGGIRLGMEQAGHHCVAFCEKDKFAVKSYREIHNTEGEDFYDDITTVTDKQWRKYKGTVDIVCGGFPCQAFSVAGKRKGFDDVRGTMFFYLANAVKQIEPRYFIFENVKGLLNHDKGRTFGTILNALDELGYDVSWHLYNSKDYGVPQNRERVYIVGHSRRYGRREILPFGREGEQFTKGIGNRKSEGVTKEVQVRAILTPNRLTRRQKGRRFKDNGEPSFTVNTQDRHGVLIKSKRDLDMRMITPLESWRLQGFPDELFYRAQAVNSDSQLYKQAGNSVTVNAAYEVAKQLKDD
ncbi:DNA cytosine methyltransferase [Brochothrix thermosphacta]|uniref:DNA cytosine methyltransferase n=1 Tax=Brochothrix thermosphacta TaxID=2756 RepID=UPI0027130087|nr:DNA cytosine methyltransferase [Brochothrix thermosphacta]MDO7864787.1 DNA cytosine methyltransferase [Brochothrix thermosphacta]